MMTNEIPTDQQVTATMEEMQRLNTMLLRSNNDLLQYAHVASHDLQEPLRKIQFFSDLLLNRAEGLEDKEIIQKILSSADRMSLLITDLLAHSKLTIAAKMSRPVDLNSLVAGILDDFELAVKEKKASISMDQLPVVNAVALEMNQLFYNLIDNALKFSSPLRSPEIAIKCKKLENAAVLEYLDAPLAGRNYYDIAVSDNGIGFEARYAEQIFKIFNRLHPKDVYSGSGIGLSLCRNILTNHGGTLSVASKPGEGATFHIIIPE